MEADEVTKKAQEVLLPNQLGRIQQIVRQRKLIAKVGKDRTKLFLKLGDELGLSKDELKKFKKDLVQIREEFLNDMAKLKRKHDRKVVDALPLEAAKKANELLGEIYLDF